MSPKNVKILHVHVDENDPSQTLNAWVTHCFASTLLLASQLFGTLYQGVSVFLTSLLFVSSVVLTLSLPESIMETCNVVLTSESVDEILWCDHAFK